MTRSTRLTLLTFLESCATVFVQRAIYFYTRDRLHYSDGENLAIALLMGAAYIAGARVSHRLAHRFGERAALAGAVGLLLLFHLLLAATDGGVMMVGFLLGTSVLSGIKWPVVESFVSAGLAPVPAARAIGRFNIAWSLSVPFAMFVAGPLIGAGSAMLFVVAAGLNAASLAVLRPLERALAHLPTGHPDRLSDRVRGQYGRLLVSSRWSLLSSYSLLFLLSPLLPGIFHRLQVPVRWATGLAAVLDLMRFVMFVFMRRYPGWHGRNWPVVAPILALPIGFVLAAFVPRLAWVLAGEVLFGLSAGAAYYAALYYALAVKNASVDAGGGHEQVIGLGSLVGPLIGLGGQWLAIPLGSLAAGLGAAMAPVILICAVAALKPLAELRRPAP
jgi:hypothetical protein